MSEPLSAHEIEDVLSSIRRLVSEELRPAAASGTAAALSPPGGGEPSPSAPVTAAGASPAAAPQAKLPPLRAPRMAAETVDAGKLLLTPALRVVPSTPEPEAVPVARHWGAPEPFARAGEDPPVAATDQARTDQAGRANLSALLAGQGDPAGGYDEDEVWAAPGDPVEDDPAPATDWPQAGDGWQDDEPLAFVPHPRKAPAAPAAAPQDEPLARAWAEQAEAQLRAELGDALTAEVHAALRAEPVPDPVPQPAARAEDAPRPQPEPGLFDQDATVLDEDMLRDLVREIIREELAGALGERITRNVRKLVRMEVNRALTARDFG